MGASDNHLENITPTLLIEFKNDEHSFVRFASSISKYGLIQVGVNCKGSFITKKGGEEVVEHTHAFQAVDEYKKLLKNKS